MSWSSIFTQIKASIVNPLDDLIVRMAVKLPIRCFQVKKNEKFENFGGGLVVYEAVPPSSDGGKETHVEQIQRNLKEIFEERNCGFLVVHNCHWLKQYGYTPLNRYEGRVTFMDRKREVYAASHAFFLGAIFVAAVVVSICYFDVSVSISSVIAWGAALLTTNLVVKQFERSSLRAMKSQRELLEIQTLSSLSGGIEELRELSRCGIDEETFDSRKKAILGQINYIRVYAVDDDIRESARGLVDYTANYLRSPEELEDVADNEDSSINDK